MSSFIQSRVTVVVTDEVTKGTTEVCKQLLFDFMDCLSTKQTLDFVHSRLDRWKSIEREEHHLLSKAVKELVVRPASDRWTEKWISTHPGWFTSGGRCKAGSRYRSSTALKKLQRKDQICAVDLSVIQITEVLMSLSSALVEKVLRSCRIWPRLVGDCLKEVRRKPVYWAQQMILDDGFALYAQNLWDRRERCITAALWWFQCCLIHRLWVQTWAKPLYKGAHCEREPGLMVGVQVCRVWNSDKVALDFTRARVGWSNWAPGLANHQEPRFDPNYTVTIRCTGTLRYEVCSGLPCNLVQVLIPSSKAIEHWVKQQEVTASCGLPSCCQNIVAGFLIPL